MTRSSALLFCLCVPLFGGDTLPIRGLHLGAPRPEDMPLCLRFIEEALPKEGVNTLVLEFNYGYDFARRPEVAESRKLSKADVQAIAGACRKAGVRLIPQISLFGHQSSGTRTGGLLRSHPEFDETPGQYPDNKGIYCRSYCPLHPKLHEVVFDLIDELMEASGADAFHAGMDEILTIGESTCPRCKGQDRAELFAGEVKAIHDHLALSGRRLWIWGDRLLDSESTGIHYKESSANGTHAAIRMIPKDIVICDWHYSRVLPTISYFALQGFAVVGSPWKDVDVALGQLDQIQTVRAQANDTVAARVQGVLQTTWCGFGAFAQAYFGEPMARPNADAVASAACFKALSRQIRRRKLL